MRKLLNWVSCSMLAAVFLHNHTMAQPLPQDAKLVSGVLKNGFRYYIYPQQGAQQQQSAIQLFVNAGSLQENDQQLGLAHFVEHMAFNGSANYPKNQVVTFLESLGVKFGADLNAHTSFDETVYKISIDSREAANLYKAIDIMHDWAFNLSFDSLEIEQERGIIIEEWRTKQGASSRMSDQSLPLIFYNSRYADRKPIGTLEVLRTFQRPTIVDFYKSWYRPEMMALAVVTNQDVKAVEKEIKKRFGKAKNAKNAPLRQPYTLANHQDTLMKVYTDAEATSVDFSYITKLPAMPPLRDKANLTYEINRTVVNALIKKRFERLAQKTDAYKSASMSFSDLLLHNGLSFGGAVLYEDHIHAGIAKFLEEQQRIVRYGFTKVEIADFKKQYRAQLERSSSGHTVNAYLMLLQLKDVFFTGEVLMDRQTKREYTLDILGQIDSAALQQHVAQYFKPGNTVVLLSAPERLQAQLPTQAQLARYFSAAAMAPVQPWRDSIEVPTVLLEKDPQPGQVTHKTYIEAIDAHKWTLSNGAQVYIKQSSARKNHLQLTGFRKGGLLSVDSIDYVNAVYAKDITGQSGAGAFSRQALTKFLTGNSASATFIISQHREGLSASANKKDVKTMFELLFLKWTQPRVDPIVFKAIKKRAIDQAKTKVHQVNDAYGKAISAAVGAEDNDQQDLSAARLEKDLQQQAIASIFSSRFGSAQDFNFVVIGDMPLDSLQPYLERYIGGLPAGPYAEKQRLPNYEKAENQDFTVYAGAADKATVNMFYQTTAINYDYPEIIKNELLENILKVKLRKSLREEHSGVYSVGVSVSATSEPTALFRARINFTCEPERKDFLMQQAGAQVDKIALDPSYIEEELNNAKVQLIQAYDKQYGKESFWSAELRNHVYFKFADWRYFQQYAELVTAISAADISNWTREKMVKAYQVKAVLMPEKLKK